MTINFIPHGKHKIAEITADNIIISSLQEGLDIMVDCIYQDADRIILYEKNIHPDFFDLKTKLAGDILQKFSTYQAFLAIVGRFDNYESLSLRDFIRESNRVKRVNFVSSLAEAIAALG